MSETGTEGLYFAFLIDDTAFFVGSERGASDPQLPGFEYVDQSIFRTAQPRHLAFAGITGMQLMRWLASERYCGFCGTPLEESTWERAFVCPQCGKITYPKLMPAVIVAITHEDKILVTGHTPTLYIDPGSKGRIWRGNGHIALDCGAGFGLPLGCIRLDDGEEFYVE